MVIVDKFLEHLERQEHPIRVALVGTGYMARAYALQFLTAVRGMRLVAIAGRNVEAARRLYIEGGVDDVQLATTVGDLEDAVARGRFSVAQDGSLLCRASGIDVVIEATGQVEFGAGIATCAIDQKKHVVLGNAELDATLGPILKAYADRAGVVITNIDGDEPGVAMNLVRFAESVGCTPVVAGNLKGFIDPYRTPATQEAFARKNGQRPPMITSFADGTKLSMETALVANATGLQIAKRGMMGPKCASVKDAVSVFPLDAFLRYGGVVDYLLGAEPGTGAFVVGYNSHPIKQQYMSYFKMGDGPFYVFYTPFHLPHLQLPHTVARAALFHDATVAPMGAPVCDVIALAKRALRAGDVLDGIGGFTCYGRIERARVAERDNLLPMGLTEGCRLKRDVAIDQEIRYDDIELPAGRLSDKLRAEQKLLFGSPKRPGENASSLRDCPALVAK